jgi:diacylglycerol kinase (ATP)
MCAQTVSEGLHPGLWLFPGAGYGEKIAAEMTTLTGGDNVCVFVRMELHETSAEARPFQFTGRIRSFRHAIIGILRMVRCQHNAWIHVVATFVVLAAGFFFSLSWADWCWIILAISIVWTAEALNTAFEFLADVAAPEFHPLVRDAKDVAAGAVLITGLAAAIIGAIVFWPYVERLF